MRFAAAAAIAAAWVCAPTAAQEQAGESPGAASGPEALVRLTKELGAEDVRTRLAASEELQESTFTLRDLEGMLAGDSLSLEQRRRLLNVARVRFYSEPRAAMGVQFDPRVAEARGVVVVPRPEFDAATVLRPGDRLLEASGLVLGGQEDLRKIIVAHDPGDELPLVYERDGVRMQATIRLGAFETLGQQMDHGVMLRAWAHRSRKFLRQGGAGPIESGLTEAAWMQPAIPGDEAGDLALTGQEQFEDAGRSGVVAGGEARHGIGGSHAVVRLGTGLDRRQRELQSFYQRRQQYAEEMARNRAMLGQGNLEPGRAKELNARNEQLGALIESCDRQIQLRIAAPLGRDGR